MKRYLLIFILIITATCSPSNRRDGYVYFRLNTNPTTLDPALIVDVQGGMISAKIFNGLVKLDKDLRIVPDIAVRWEVTDDGRTYTFYLKKNVRFSNGREVTAEDFRFSFERVLSPRFRSPNTWVLDKILGSEEFMDGKKEYIEGIEVIDRYTLRLKLKERFSPFLGLLTMPPAYVVPEEVVRTLGNDFSSRPVGTGPFILKEWRHNQEIILGARNDYFGGTPKIKGIIYRIIPEDLTAITEFEVSNLDILSLPASAIKKFRNDPERNRYIIEKTGLNIYYLGMNCSKPPFNRKNIRRAVSYGIDRKKILETIYEKRGELAAGIIPPALRYWENPTIPEYNPQYAMKLIKSSRYGGEKIDFYITADKEVVDIAEVIENYLKKIGLNVRIRQLEWSAYKEALVKGEPHLFWLSWWADYPDPENFLFPLFHSSNLGARGNRVRYVNPEVDRLIELGQKTINKKKRREYYAKGESIIINDLPIVPFWHKKEIVIIQPYIENFDIVPVYSIDKGLTISLKTED